MAMTACGRRRRARPTHSRRAASRRRSRFRPARLILPIEAALIEGGAYALSHAGTAQARVWQGTGYAGSGSYAAASRSAPLLVTGLTANTQTNVEFSSGTILRPQFEPGAYATDFERRPPGVELALCQRYIQRIVGWVGAWRGGSSTIATVAGRHIVPMYSSPTVLLVSGLDMLAQFGTAFHNVSTIDSFAADNMAGYLDLTTSSGGAGQPCAITNNGRLFAISEL